MTDRETTEPADAALGFDPAVPTGGGDDLVAPARRPRPASRSRWRRRLGGAAVLVVTLAGIGGVSTAFAGASNADGAAISSASDVSAGQSIYQTACITCHGANLEGVQGRGPALVGVGQAAVYYQVATGRMPVAAQGAQVDRKPPQYTEEQIEQIAAYVETFGGGPSIPAGNLRADTAALAEGGELFRLNCAQCHGFAGAGAPLSAGKYAPTLKPATDKEIYGALLSGPENMPVFNDNQLTPDQKKAIIGYIQTLKAQKDPGGAGIGRVGPVGEGLVIWIVGIGAIMGLILWIGRKTA